MGASVDQLPLRYLPLASGVRRYQAFPIPPAPGSPLAAMTVPSESSNRLSMSSGAWFVNGIQVPPAFVRPGTNTRTTANNRRRPPSGDPWLTRLPLRFSLAAKRRVNSVRNTLESRLKSEFEQGFA